MKKLAELTADKNNNLNLIRILAAFAVLISHSFAIVTGDVDAEPLRALLGVTPGTLAVDVFFVTSGLLLANSLSKKGNALEFIISRVARIYPALIVAVLLTVFVLGPIFTKLTFIDYLQNKATYTYFFKTTTLVRDVGYTLPGVFSDNPLYNQVNGSLWTLPFELKMYILLFCTWYACKVMARSHASQFLKLCIFGITAVAGILYAQEYINSGGIDSMHSFSRFTFIFFSGACLGLYQNRILISPWILGVALLAIVVSAIDKTAFFFVWHALIGYTVVLLAYQSSRLLARYNKVGDYSYGVYIYAFSIQQALMASIVDISVPSMILYSAVLTAMLAFLSWHLIEKPVMKKKNILLARLKLCAAI